MYLKDKNNNNVLPNTSAENVSYGSTNLAAKIAELEQGGGGGSTPSTDGVALPNIFTQDMVVSGRGITAADGPVSDTTKAQIVDNAQMSCVFVPLDLDSYYCIDGIVFAGIPYARSLVVLAKGTHSSFSNLTVDDFADGSQFMVNNDDFYGAVNICYRVENRYPQGMNPWILSTDIPIVIKTPAAADLANPNTTIGIVFNIPTVDNVDLSGVHIVKGCYPVEYANSIRGKNIVCFGDSITEAKTHLGHVGIIWDALGLNRADNFGSTGGGDIRVADIVLGENFRNDGNGNQYRKDYRKYSAATIQIGTNIIGFGMSGNEPASLDSLRAQAAADIPDISAYDVMIGLARNGSYAYSDTTKTIKTATLYSVEDFFKQCFANTYFGNVALAIEYIQWKNPNCRVYLLTIPKNIGYANYKGINNCIMVLGELLSVPVIDAANGAMMTRANVTYWSRDDWKQHIIEGTEPPEYRYRLTHTNVAGMAMWGGYISSQLRSMYYDTDIEDFVVPADATAYPDRPMPRDYDLETGNVTS